MAGNDLKGLIIDNKIKGVGLEISTFLLILSLISEMYRIAITWLRINHQI